MGFRTRSILIQAIALPLIYIPILFLPFVILCGLFTYAHLRLMGATRIKGFRDFVPRRETHRYTTRDQPVLGNNIPLMRSKLYWSFNCTVYCPNSVGLFAWITYMVKIVENWWCPFFHERKGSYSDAKIDQSFWHMYRDSADKLHPSDRENPIWNGKPES
ncbi:MAG: hypothetical protein K8S54_06345 [Spirochaetia bacterium]|nr:hypothetical protein [Spirochaetia bacterium]